MRRRWMALIVCALLATGCATTVRTEGTAMKTISGEFEVTLTPQAPDPARPWAPGRMLIDKQFKGGVEGTGSGEMLAVMTEVKGSAGYVAIERVTGAVEGRSGTFALQHSGTMTRGTPTLVVTVVPDSGTGELEGLSGEMTIDVTGGKHAYTFSYRLR